MSMDAVNSGFPLLPEQQRLLDKAGPQGTWAEVAHLVQVEIAGELDLARLRSALDALVQRFPVLATRIGQVPGYNGLRQLAGEGGGFPLQVVAEPGPAASVAALFEAWAGAPHPIPGGVHLGGLLQCLESGRWRLSLGVARFIVDARSMGLLARRCSMPMRAMDRAQAMTTRRPASSSTWNGTRRWRWTKTPPRASATGRSTWARAVRPPTCPAAAGASRPAVGGA